MADRGTSFDRALAIVTAFEAAGETSAARLLLVAQIQDLIDAAAAGPAPPKGALTMDEQFFIVWNPNGMGPPRFRHPTSAAAEKESLRLARENPGHRFYVMGNLGHAARPAPVFTPVHPPQLRAIDANVGEVTVTGVMAASGAEAASKRSRGATHIIADAEYIPGVKSKDGDPASDSLERAGAEVIRLRTWLHRIREATSGAGGISPRQRAIIHTACSEALTCEPPPFPNQAKASLPGFDEAASVEVEEKTYRILVHGVYRPGDRVRYTGRSGHSCRAWVGRTGSIAKTFEPLVDVIFDDAVELASHKSHAASCHVHNIEHESLPQFEVGDEVRARSGDTGIIESIGAITASIMGSDGHGFTTHLCHLTFVRPVQHRDGAK